MVLILYSPVNARGTTRLLDRAAAPANLESMRNSGRVKPARCVADGILHDSTSFTAYSMHVRLVLARRAKWTVGFVELSVDTVVFECYLQ